MELRRLGSTIDDAIGEAYDKVATILGLEYPGGPKLDKLAQQGDDRAHDFPVSLLDPQSLDFSYSGLKTAVLYAVRGKPVRDGDDVRFERDFSNLSEDEKADIAASFQRAAVNAVVRKLERALEHNDCGGTGVSPVNPHDAHRPRADLNPRTTGQLGTHGRDARATDANVYRSLLVGGGVSANSHLRATLPTLAERFDLDLHLPSMRYCLDNAAMIAGLGNVQVRAGETDDMSLQAIPTTAC